MKMLSKERTYIDFSLGMVLYLLKGQTCHSIKLYKAFPLPDMQET